MDLDAELLGSANRGPRKAAACGRGPLLLLVLALILAVTLAAVFLGLYVHGKHAASPAAASPSTEVAELRAALESERAVAAEAKRNATTAQGQLATAQAALVNTNIELITSAVRLNVTAAALHHTAAQLVNSQELVADLRTNGPPPPSPSTLSAEAREWILEAMDPTADPCNDFVQYTCGAWQAANPVDPNNKYATPNLRSFINASARITQAEQKVLETKFEKAAQVRAEQRKRENKRQQRKFTVVQARVGRSRRRGGSNQRSSVMLLLGESHVVQCSSACPCTAVSTTPAAWMGTSPTRVTLAGMSLSWLWAVGCR